MVGEDVDPPRAVGAGGVAELHRLGVGEPDHRRRVEAHPDREALGELLERRVAGDQRRAVAGRDARGEAALRRRSSAGTSPGRPLAPGGRGRAWRTRGRSRSAPWRPPAVRSEYVRRSSGLATPLRTAASFQPRFHASAIETFMPWPALALCVWQASPAMNTRGGRSAPPARRRSASQRRWPISYTDHQPTSLISTRVRVQDAVGDLGELLRRHAAPVPGAVELDVEPDEVAALARDDQDVAVWPR